MLSSPVSARPQLAVSVWATVELPGFHHWPGATGHRAYLGDSHRHLFRITAEVSVTHNDRQVEFHDLGDLIHEWWRQTGAPCPTGGALNIAPRDMGPWSCEDLARSLHEYLTLACGLSVVQIEVSEDGEFGARVRGQR